jgi:hypothetical protein
MKRRTLGRDMDSRQGDNSPTSLNMPLSYPNFPLSPLGNSANKFQVFPALIYADDDGVVHTYVIRSKHITIGSASDNAIILLRLDDVHAQIDINKKTIILTDRGAGKISVNDAQVKRYELQPGDNIRIDRYMFCLALKAQEAGTKKVCWEPYPMEKDRLALGGSPILSGEGLELLTRIRKIREFSHRASAIYNDDPDDYEQFLEFAGTEILELFGAARAYVVLFEEDGRNPVLTVKRYRPGYEPFEPEHEANPGTASTIADATQMEINETILRRTVREKALIRLEHENEDGHSTSSKEGLAAPIMHENRVLGLLYFDRPMKEPIRDIEEDLFDLVARLLAHPLSHFVG